MLQAIKLEPKKAEWRSSYGSLLSESGYHKKAAQELRVALDLEPKQPSHYSDLGTLLQGSHIKQYGESIKMFEAANRLRKPAPPDVIKEAMAHEALKAPGWEMAAAGIYDAAVTYLPNSAMLHHNLGEMRLAMGHFPEAIKAYTRATELSPNSRFTFQRLGDALGFNQRYGDAHRAYHKSFTIRRGEGFNDGSWKHVFRCPEAASAATMEELDALSVCQMEDPRNKYEDMKLTAAHKLWHDAESLQHLASVGLVSGQKVEKEVQMPETKANPDPGPNPNVNSRLRDCSLLRDVSWN